MLDVYDEVIKLILSIYQKILPVVSLKLFLKYVYKFDFIQECKMKNYNNENWKIWFHLTNMQFKITSNLQFWGDWQLTRKFLSIITVHQKMIVDLLHPNFNKFLRYLQQLYNAIFAQILQINKFLWLFYRNNRLKEKLESCLINKKILNNNIIRIWVTSLCIAGFI